MAPAAVSVAKAISPAANAATPIPAAKHPTPSKAMAPLSANMAGTIGASTSPATPMTRNAPASASSPLPISPQLNPPRVVNIGVNIARAAAITSSAAELANMPGASPASNANPAARANIPPIAAPALASSSQFI